MSLIYSYRIAILEGKVIFSQVNSSGVKEACILTHGPRKTLKYRNSKIPHHVYKIRPLLLKNIFSFFLAYTASEMKEPVLVIIAGLLLLFCG